MKVLARSFVLVLAVGGSAPVLGQWSIDALSLQRTGLASASVGGLALFAGGGENSPQPFSVSAVVDIYDSASATWSTATLSVARAQLAATVVGNRALFAGGQTSPSVLDASAVVDVFDAQTMTWSTATLSQARSHLCATTVGTKAMFAGGYGGSGPPWPSGVVDIYDDATGVWSTATLSQARALVAAASVGSQALFAGGWDGGMSGAGSDVVDIYDDATGVWSTATLSQARALAGDPSVSLGTRAYFAGGMTNVITETRSDRVDIYDAQTSTWSFVTLSEPRSGLGAAAIGNRVLFAGGLQDQLVHIASDVVDILDATTGNWLGPAALSQGHTYIDAVTIGGRAMFPGGKLGSGLGTTSLIDIYDPDFGERYCSPAIPNSTGLPGVTMAIGRTSVAANDFSLSAEQLPVNFGFFLNSMTQGSFSPPNSQGILCLGGATGRHNQLGLVQQGPSFRIQLDLTSVPTPSAFVAVLPGDTWNFQCWYRDSNPGPTSNFTDAVSVTFQ